MWSVFASLIPVCHRAHRWCYDRARGQGLVEYGLILVLIMVVCVAIISMVGQSISEVWYQKLIQGW